MVVPRRLETYIITLQSILNLSAAAAPTAEWWYDDQAEFDNSKPTTVLSKEEQL